MVAFSLTDGLGNGSQALRERGDGSGGLDAMLSQVPEHGAWRGIDGNVEKPFGKWSRGTERPLLEDFMLEDGPRLHDRRY